MKWLQAKTVEDLKALGSFKDLRNSIKADISPKIRLTFRGWQELLDVIQDLQKLIPSPVEASPVDSALSSSELSQAGYFQSEAARIIYALVELDGESRLKELGIDRSYTKNKEKAKQWRNNTAKIIHPDICKHPKAVEASAKLVQIYEQMTR